MNRRHDRHSRVESSPLQPVVVASLADASSRVQKRFRGRLSERFGPNGKDESLDFHNPGHSEEVVTHAWKFLDIIREIDPALVSDLDLELIRIEGLAHDVVQRSTKPRGRLRLRHRGYRATDVPRAVRSLGVAVGNELASARELLAELARYRFPDGRHDVPVADPAFRKEIADDIGATFPAFKRNAEIDGDRGLKMYQPHLTARSSLRALALATADTRADIGSNPDPDVYRRHGNAEFRELRHAMKAQVLNGIERLEPQRRIQISRDILGWVREQIAFAKWQKVLFFESLERNRRLNSSPKASAIKKALRRQYRYFDSNIRAVWKRCAKLEREYGDPRDAKAFARRIRELSAEQLRALFREMGYAR